MIEKITDGDIEKQGNMVCPHCGGTHLVTNHWGDPPKCPSCDSYLRPILRQPDYS